MPPGAPGMNVGAARASGRWGIIHLTLEPTGAHGGLTGTPPWTVALFCRADEQSSRQATAIVIDRRPLPHALIAQDPKAASAAGLVEASVLQVMEPFEFVSQMQNAALEVSYHQVIRRRTGQSLSGLLFESFVPPFKISNMIRFRHGSLRNYASGSKKQSGRATGG